MRVAYLIITLFLTLPFLGLFTMTDRELNAYGLSVGSLYELREAYPLYLMAYGGAVAASIMLFKRRARPTGLRTLHENEIRDLRRRITIFLCFALLLAFYISGYAILTGATHRGELRVSFGRLGFVYKTFMQFCVPATLVVSAVLYRMGARLNMGLAFPLHHMMLGVGIFAMMGYKSGVITGILPFLIAVISIIRWRYQVLMLGLLVAVLVIYSSIILGMNGLGRNDLSSVSAYLMTRATSGTAWGLVSAWELFQEPQPRALMSLLPVLGPRITAQILGITPGTVEYLMLGSGNYVTYLVHPRPDLVLSGETNLTITLAGEATYLLGQRWFWLIAIPVGFVTGLLCALLDRTIRDQRLFLTPLLTLFLVNVILPILNSGGIVSLFSAFNIFYFTATFFFLKLFLRPYRTRPFNAVVQRAA